MNAYIKGLVHEDKGDPWGCAMNAWFLVSGALYERGEDIPGHWFYRPGAGALDDFDASDIEEISLVASPDLIHAGNVLERYTRCLDHAGRSY